MKYTGHDLIKLGYKPSKLFRNALAFINSKNGDITEDEIYAFMAQNLPVERTDFIEPYEHPNQYYMNIRATCGGDAKNIASVVRDMDMVMKTPTTLGGAVMPDACPTGLGNIPVGGVVVTKNAIHPAFHSADVCCSVYASDFGYKNPKDVLDEAHKITHFGVGGRKENGGRYYQYLFDELSDNPFINNPKNKIYVSEDLGTQGDGNHFLFVGISKTTGRTMMVTHHGSRRFGANVFKLGMQVAERFRKELSPRTPKNNAWIPFDTQEGHDYWKALKVVEQWTYFSHSYIHDRVHQQMKTLNTNFFWNPHNFVFKSGDMFFHAKGATPLADEFIVNSPADSPRIIPMNMGQPILLVSGKRSQSNLGFAPHGAGRNVSRNDHKRMNEGRTIEEIFNEETRGLDIRFYSGVPDISELPSAYKSADQIKSQMEEFGLGEIVDEIIPYGSIMAGGFNKRELKQKKVN
jgi:tRNA-splicing ligase RtcB (3'-phosphate/5'-hydroxy nucleic acid ligase)